MATIKIINLSDKQASSLAIAFGGNFELEDALNKVLLNDDLPLITINDVYIDSEKNPEHTILVGDDEITDPEFEDDNDEESTSGNDITGDE